MLVLILTIVSMLIISLTWPNIHRVHYLVEVLFVYITEIAKKPSYTNIDTMHVFLVSSTTDSTASLSNDCKLLANCHHFILNNQHFILNNEPYD